MVKIKVKKEMNLAELIQWAWDNPELAKNRTFKSNPDDSVPSKIDFNFRGNMSLENSGGYCPRKDTLFSVTVEEEITEETKIPLLLEIKKLPNGILLSFTSHSKNIEESKESDSFTFHMINPDGTLTLLWTREGGMQ